MDIQQGQFVEVRGRPWLVEAVDDREPDLMTLRLSCIADDAQGEQIEVLWDAEIGARIIQDDTWSQVGRGAPDGPEVLAAYLRAIRWRSATAADRDLFQAPFRAGIRLDAYQLLPLRKALRLPPFNRLGEFPAEQPNDLPLSPTAEAFYRSGPSFWQRYTSFWLTSLLNRIVFFVIPVVAALVPVIGFAPRLYRWLTRAGNEEAQSGKASPWPFRRDPTAWLGREDSNLRMAESKSTYFA
jgi:hypothetical protein